MKRMWTPGNCFKPESPTNKKQKYKKHPNLEQQRTQGIRITEHEWIKQKSLRKKRMCLLGNCRSQSSSEEFSRLPTANMGPPHAPSTPGSSITVPQICNNKRCSRG
jgi:hypothetical protein